MALYFENFFSTLYETGVFKAQFPNEHEPTPYVAVIRNSFINLPEIAFMNLGFPIEEGGQNDSFSGWYHTYSLMLENDNSARLYSLNYDPWMSCSGQDIQTLTFDIDEDTAEPIHFWPHSDPSELWGVVRSVISPKFKFTTIIDAASEIPHIKNQMFHQAIKGLGLETIA